jgi:hypothetical protein
MRTRRPAATLLALALLALVVTVLATPTAGAEETRLAVRVISKGAKFIGSSMGGVRITVEDADTGELLADGLTAGSTGDTEIIMVTPRGRRPVLSTPGSAVFTTSLDLDAPRRLEITASGPQAQRQALNQVSMTQWVVPGKHLDGGDGLLLEMPGLVVDVLAPPAHVRAGTAPLAVELTANVTMMCGCPITPGGMWDADALEVRAIVHHDGERLADVPLAYAGSASQFRGTFTAAKPGLYDVTIYAYDPADGNTGLDRTTFLVGG